MKTCSDANSSVNGVMMYEVAKQKNNPRVIEIGKAGRAFFVIARSIKVKQSPCRKKKIQFNFLITIHSNLQLTIRIETKVAIVAFQSPYELALPTSTE